MLLLQTSSPHTVSGDSSHTVSNDTATHCFTFILQMRKLKHGLFEIDILMVEPRYKVGQFDF